MKLVIDLSGLGENPEQAKQLIRDALSDWARARGLSLSENDYMRDEMHASHYVSKRYGMNFNFKVNEVLRRLNMARELSKRIEVE